MDSGGSAYVAGTTDSKTFPIAGGYQPLFSGVEDVFVTKLNAQGTGLVYSTYIGGKKNSAQAAAIALDASGNAYIAGTTDSTTYPTTTGAYSTSGTGFVTKLNASGNALIYSTRLPGTLPAAIQVDATGNAYVAGISQGGLPTTTGAIKTSFPTGSTATGFVTKLNAAGSALVYSTYLGGSTADAIRGLAINSAGNAYVTGYTSSTDFPIVAGAYQTTHKGGTYDGFVSKLNSTGTALVSSTYLGGTGRDYASAIALDSSGKIYVAGDTYSTDFPVANGYGKPGNTVGANAAFVTVLTPDAGNLAMSTYFGGYACLTEGVYSCYPTDPNDVANSIAVDPSGTNIYIAGFLSSIDVLGITVGQIADPIQKKISGTNDAFVAKIVVDPFTQRILNFRYVTRLGGNEAGATTAYDRATGLAIDVQGNAYVVGSSGAANFPTTQGAFHTALSTTLDAFIFKVSTLGTPITLDGGCGGPYQPAQTAQLRATLALNDTGNVSFVEGGTTLATVPIVNGVATYSGPAPIGVHKYSAIRTRDGVTSAPLYCAVSQ